MSKKKSQKIEIRLKLKPTYLTCEDCHAKYVFGSPHYMFCEARACTECGIIGPYVLAEDADGQRFCVDCLSNDMPFDYDDDVSEPLGRSEENEEDL